MPADTILKGIEGLTWNLPCTACERDYVALIGQPKGAQKHWCLEHRSSVFPEGQESLMDEDITHSQLYRIPILEYAAAYASVDTSELLGSRGAPWVTPTASWHLRLRQRGFMLVSQRKNTKITRRRILKSQKLDVNALDHLAKPIVGGRKGTPICYLAEISGVN
ncbi:hypothetical protein DM02DRAFT_660641 [Periconia macrospinosa]|uniref:Uncharacterized protein n=1 Tax=Periconia macrospinosa TaxID=97972 RepID=A0A2V1D9U9_9PLEO|nr:hypothetical protein DM02DRAFT_660641 [Periconia macrospinosa]